MAQAIVFVLAQLSRMPNGQLNQLAAEATSQRIPINSVELAEEFPSTVMLHWVLASKILI